MYIQVRLPISGSVAGSRSPPTHPDVPVSSIRRRAGGEIPTSWAHFPVRCGDDEDEKGKEGKGKRETRLTRTLAPSESSSSRTNQFKELASRNISLDMIQDGIVWYEMLRVAVEKDSAIDSFSKAWYEAVCHSPQGGFVGLVDSACTKVLKLARNRPRAL